MVKQTKCIQLAKKLRKAPIYMARMAELVTEAIELSKSGKYVEVIFPPEKKLNH